MRSLNPPNLPISPILTLLLSCFSYLQPDPLQVSQHDAFAKLIPKVSANTAQKLIELNASLHGHNNSTKTPFMSLHGDAAKFQGDALSKSIHEHHGYRDLDSLSSSAHGHIGPLHDPLAGSRHGDQVYNPKLRYSLERAPSNRSSLDIAPHAHHNGSRTGTGTPPKRLGSFLENEDKKMVGSSGLFATAASELAVVKELGKSSEKRIGSEKGLLSSPAVSRRIQLPKLTPDDDPLSNFPANSPPAIQEKLFPVLPSLPSSEKEIVPLTSVPQGGDGLPAKDVLLVKDGLPAIGESIDEKSIHSTAVHDKHEKNIHDKRKKSLPVNGTIENSNTGLDSKPDSMLDNTTHDGSWPVSNGNHLNHSPEVGGGGDHDTVNHAGGGGVSHPPHHDHDTRSRRKKVTLFGTKPVPVKPAGLHDSEPAGGSFWIDGERVRLFKTQDTRHFQSLPLTAAARYCLAKPNLTLSYNM